jgi:serine/threonine protein kinase
MEFCPRTLREEIVYRSDKDDGYFEKEQFYWLAYCIGFFFFFLMFISYTSIILNLFFLYLLVAANKELKEKNIYHGDIKPENILKKDKNYKLADFGEANEDSKTDKKGS